MAQLQTTLKICFTYTRSLKAKIIRIQVCGKISPMKLSKQNINFYLPRFQVQTSDRFLTIFIPVDLYSLFPLGNIMWYKAEFIIRLYLSYIILACFSLFLVLFFSYTMSLLKLRARKTMTLTESQQELQRQKLRKGVYRVYRTGVRSGLTKFVNLVGCQKCPWSLEHINPCEATVTMVLSWNMCLNELALK